MKSLTVRSIILLATHVSGTLAITIPLTKLQRNGAYLEGVAHADRTRAAFFSSLLDNESRQSTTPATNLAYTRYTVSVGIGNPPTYYQLVADTGSSNTFCGTGIPYVQTNTSISTGQDVNVNYGSGDFNGAEYLDQLTLVDNLVISNQSIGDALDSDGFNGVDGLLGLGPVSLTQGSLSPNNTMIVPTVMNNLVSQGLVQNQVLGVYFVPSTSNSDENGALTLGGDNSSLYTGGLSYAPLTNTSPASNYWGINIDSATYGNATIIPKSTAGIVDTGTTPIPGAVYNPNLGLIDIPLDSVSTMEPLMFVVGGTTFAMDVTAQLISMDQNKAWGGEDGHQYGVVTPLGSFSGQEMDFILGQKFMERYYAVFDTDNNRVGFAQTAYTFTIYN